VRQPTAFLFDEPLSNLDAALRVEMRFELADLHKTLGTTMFYVTHDQVEAMTLADQIVVLKDGRVMQTGSPGDLYERPDSLFVAQFIGSPKMNILPIGVIARSGPPGATHLGIRPEHIVFSSAHDNDVSGTVRLSEYMGADSFVYVDCAAAGTVLVRIAGRPKLRAGESVGLRFDPGQSLYFDQNDQTIIQGGNR
jgi:multiple sugar transport system ATP-binding protein